MTVDEHRPARRIVEARHEVDERGLAGSRRADDRKRGARLDDEVDALEDLRSGGVGEAHAAKLDAPLHGGELVGVGRVRDLALGVEEREDALTAGERGLGVGVQTRKLAHRVEKRPRVAEEGDHNADGDEVLDCEPPAERRNECGRHRRDHRQRG